MLLVLGLLIGVYLVLPVHDQPWLPPWIAMVAILTALVLLAIFARWAILHLAFPLLREIQAIAFIVSFATIGFAGIYASVAAVDDAAFSEPLNRIGALYLSVVTASTVGFGDIHARSDAARIVVMLQIITSIGLVGVVIQVIRRAMARRVEVDRG